MSIRVKINIRTRSLMSIEKRLEFPEFLGDSVVSERNLPEKWGTHRG